MAVNIKEAIQQLAPGALIELFQIDLTPIQATAGVVYFHSGTNDLGGPVVWQGLSYQRFPVEAEGFDRTTKGTLPRPTMRVANVTGTISAMLLQYDDLVGAKVTRKRTFARYLDAVNFTGGVNATADPAQALDDETYFIERKVSEDNETVELELASALDFQGMRLPARTIMIGSCAWEYRRWTGSAWDYTTAQCPYNGTANYNVLNQAVASPLLDVPSKSVDCCKARFGATAILPFGGFPGARAYKS
jgi:lambda family phage minor tail protein L